MGDVWRSAWRSLSRKWTRTCLTAGSITVGVVLVTIVSAIGNAGTQAVSAELDDLGMSGLSVSASEASGELLSEACLREIRTLDGVETAVPLTIKQAEATLQSVDCEAVACGVDGGSVQAIAVQLKHGRLLTRGDVRGAAQVCVVEESLAKEAYGRGNVVGKTLWLRIGGAEYAFEIVGVAEAGSSLLKNLTSYVPDVVLLPYTTLQQITCTDGFDQIAVRATEGTNTELLGTRIVSALDRLAGVKDGFETENLAMQKSRLDSLMNIVALILTVISGVSLLVSGLGIMTIMLVSVNERVREIGIKKAIGAPRRRIWMEFLAESVALSLLGSAVGIVIGLAVSWVGLHLVGMPLSLSFGSLALLVVFCVLLGGSFGVYPAVKASHLRPVDALRQE